MESFIIVSQSARNPHFLALCHSTIIIVFFPQILSRKPQSCSSFSFVHVGIRPISNQRDRLFLVVCEACTVVSQLLNACKTQWEDSSQSVRRVTTSVYQTAEKKPPQNKVHQCVS